MPGRAFWLAPNFSHAAATLPSDMSCRPSSKRTRAFSLSESLTFSASASAEASTSPPWADATAEANTDAARTSEQTARRMATICIEACRGKQPARQDSGDTGRICTFDRASPRRDQSGLSNRPGGGFGGGGGGGGGGGFTVVGGGGGGG